MVVLRGQGDFSSCPWKHGRGHKELILSSLPRDATAEPPEMLRWNGPVAWCPLADVNLATLLCRSALMGRSVSDVSVLIFVLCISAFCVLLMGQECIMCWLVSSTRLQTPGGSHRERFPCKILSKSDGLSFFCHSSRTVGTAKELGELQDGSKLM